MELGVPSRSRAEGWRDVFLLESSTGRRADVGVLWAASGSLLEGLLEAWQRRHRLTDLGAISGPWAVALWDPAHDEHILVADPVGVQPLFWARTSQGHIAVGSWLAKLVDRPDVDDTLDYEGILLDEGLDCTGVSALHRTRFAAVSRVPWGRALRVRMDGSTRLEQYWDPESLAGPDASLTLADAADMLRERIDLAIHRLTPIDEPVGAHVSGGLDGTALACRANQLLRESGSSLAAGYSWAPSDDQFPRLPGDERQLLDDVGAAERFPIRTISDVDSGDWFWDLDPNRYPESTHFRERLVLPQARADGVRVMLSGWGGDELASFNGRRVTAGLVRHGQLATVWRNSAHVSKVQSGAAPPLSRQAKALASALLSSAPDLASRVRHPKQARAVRVSDARLDTALRAFSPLAANLRRADARLARTVRDHHQYQLWLLTAGHLQHRTGWWYQTGKLMDIDYRYPLLDVGVAEAALRLPWWAFRYQGWDRVAFRLAVAPWVPNSVAWNIDKREPALFASPAVRDGRTFRREKQLSSDQTFNQVMQLVDLTWDDGPPADDDPGYVTCRPDMAPTGDALSVLPPSPLMSRGRQLVDRRGQRARLRPGRGGSRRVGAVGRAAEAASLLVLAGAAQRWIDLSKWSHVLGEVGPVPQQTVGSAAEAVPMKSGSLTERRVAVAVDRATRLLPFEPTCLAQAAAGQVMLRRRGEPGTVVVGLQPPERASGTELADKPAKWDAHAWLLGSAGALTGGSAAAGFTAVTVFRVQRMSATRTRGAGDG